MNDNGPTIQEAGATWHRLDLHLHSPAASGFGSPEVTKDQGWEDLVDTYVEQLANQEISIAALTDYNGVNIEWFEVAAAKAMNRGITLLPGTELTFREGRYGLHVLAIFAGDTELEVLNDFIRSLDKDPESTLFCGQSSPQDIHLKASFIDALKSVRNRFNCLLIFPHPDRINGFCRSLTAELAAALLTEISPDAIESIGEREKKKMQSAGVLPQEFWERTAFVDFSNSKRIEEIGKRYRSDGTLRATYLKLSKTHIDALRLALHDPESRLSLGKIPSAFHPRIRSMTISGGDFLGNLSISWNRDLNVIIGDKGSGKSALLECLRYAFAILPYCGQSPREELVCRALGPGAKVEVVLEKATQEGEIGQYRVVRRWGEEPETFQIDPGKRLSVRPSELLHPIGGPTILGQQEIYAISRSEAGQLSLLDELIGGEAHQCVEAIAKAVEALTTNAGAILEVMGELSNLEDYRQRLRRIGDEIEKNKRDSANRPAEAPDSPGAGGCLHDATSRVKSALRDCDNWRINLLASVDMAHQDLYGAKHEYSAIFQEGAIALAILKEELTVLFNKERSLLAQALENLKGLDERHQERLLQSNGEGKRNEPTLSPPTESFDQNSDSELEKERNSLVSLIGELNGREARLKNLREERQELLRQLKERRNIQNQLRTGKADAISRGLNGRLHVRVEYNGQKENFREQLLSLLKGSGVSQETVDQFIIPEATDGMILAESVRAGSAEVQTRFKLKSEIADSLIHWLTSEESRLFELETLMPQAALRLSMTIGGQWRSLAYLSEEQSAAAIVMLLFGLDGQILIIDQPDDYLQDPSLQSEIVRILREQKNSVKEGRQVILAAKDAALPVMADAELVLPLEIRDDRAFIVGEASIDDRSIREAIKSMMQGGEDAFRQRAEKYGKSSPSRTSSKSPSFQE